MLTEEQIQRLAEIIAGETGLDEEECKENVRFIDNLFEVALAFLPEDKKARFKKTFEGEFFEDLIQRCSRVGNEIVKISWLVNHRMNSIELRRV